MNIRTAYADLPAKLPCLIAVNSFSDINRTVNIDPVSGREGKTVTLDDLWRQYSDSQKGA